MWFPKSYSAAVLKHLQLSVAFPDDKNAAYQEGAVVLKIREVKHAAVLETFAAGYEVGYD